MVAKRIIPCLDVKDGRTVKGINFVGLRDVGDAVELGEMYARQGADELVYLDISATVEGRGTFVNLVRRISERINIPFTVGGGISSLDDAARLLDAGADKISVNSIEAAYSTSVAGRSYWLTHKEECVVIAVRIHVHHLDEVARSLSLCPESASSSAEECCLAGLACLLVCFLVHICHHQDLESLAVLDYHRKESIGIL